MAGQASTCWTLIEGAAAGDERGRAEFATRYLSAVRAYFVARWRGTPLLEVVDDAVQEFFLDCFRDDGALARLDPTRPGGFRPFLYGVIRNVARHVETRRARNREHPGAAEIDFEVIRSREASQASAFDHAWAVGIVQQALDRQRERAAAASDGALRRVELLRLRFGEDLPIREVARRWEVDAARVHKEYAKARREFHSALLEVVAFHQPGSPEEVERHSADLLALIS